MESDRAPVGTTGQTTEPYGMRRGQPAKTISQARRLQNIAFDSAVALHQALAGEGKDTRARVQAGSAIAQLVRAWDTATDRVRELSGKPKLGLLRPLPLKRTRAPFGPIAPVGVAAPSERETVAAVAPLTATGPRGSQG